MCVCVCVCVYFHFSSGARAETSTRVRKGDGYDTEGVRYVTTLQLYYQDTSINRKLSSVLNAYLITS